MSPTRVTNAVDLDQQLHVLVKALDSLLLSFHELSIKEQALEKRVKYAHDEYLKLAQRIPGGPEPGSTTVSEQILNGDGEDHARAISNLNTFDIVDHLRESGHLSGRDLEALSAALGCCKQLFTPHAGDDGVHLPTTDSHEHDFTTHGTQGGLGCPFSMLEHPTNPSDGVPNIENLPPMNIRCPFDAGDPIQAELHKDRWPGMGFSAPSSPPPSAPRCPIRYLDQHSPEEIAQYLEAHKHEVPRSHAICVKRYQNSSESMRQIDAKYGNLANMIQGLSEKHKPILENQEPPQKQAASSTSAERVEKWAEDVSSSLDPTPKVESEEAEARSGHFERPLREIRVGESPSRPWGIALPEQLAPNPMNSPVAPVRISAVLESTHAQEKHALGSPLAQSFQETAPGSSRGVENCPFKSDRSEPNQVNGVIDNVEAANQKFTEHRRIEHSITGVDHGVDHGVETPRPHLSVIRPPSPARIFFNGPVFFGYSAEQAALVLQQLQNLHQPM